MAAPGDGGGRRANALGGGITLGVARRAVRRGHGEFRRHARVESLRGLSQDHRADGGADWGKVATPVIPAKAGIQ